MADLEAKTSFFEKALTSSRLVSFLGIATVFTIIITFILAYLKAGSGLSTVALHYNVIIGVDLLGRPRDLYLIPLSACGVALANYLVYRFAIPKGDFLAILTAMVSWVVALVLCAAVAFLFFVN